MTRRGPPAWGKLNGGQPWGPIAWDVGRLLFNARLDEPERALMWAIIEQAWGRTTRGKGPGRPWPDARPAEINISALARATGIPRQKLQDAKRAMVRDGLILEQDGGLVPNKDGDTWPHHRIRPEAREYAREAQEGVTPVGVRGDPHGGQGVTPVGVRGDPHGGQGVTPVGVRPPISKERGRVLDSDREKKTPKERGGDRRARKSEALAAMFKVVTGTGGDQ